VEFGVIAACDGSPMACWDALYPAQRELIANDVETMVEAHHLDAVVLLGSCDKIVPGMLMAAARLDIPASWWPADPWREAVSRRRAADTTSLTIGLAMLQTGRIDRATYDRLEDCASPTCGSCSFLGTANTMCCWPRRWA